MTPHTIRLRGGWLVGESPPTTNPSRRIDLPTHRRGTLAGTLLLTRHFHRPPIDPAREWVELRIRDAPGIREVRLNGEVLPRTGTDGDANLSHRLPASLPARNELVLLVEPTIPEEPPAPWGEIALVIHPAEAAVAGP